MISMLGNCKNGVIIFKVIKRFVSNSKWIKRKMETEPLPVHRSDPVVTTLDTPEFKSIFTPELDVLSNLFKKYNYELRIAGGAVRDMLMKINPKDLDFATTATPEQMKEMFNKEEIRLINTNGEKHGTITSRINDKINFEVTTLRIDVVTNGRHADVVFTTDWLLDASRRDLTINSMFLDLEGKVYDYFYGYEDVLKRRVAFVGDPSIRICEDFLRILRYFRFYGRISEKADNHDEKTIEAIKNNVQGLEIISGERIWNEWSKILCGNFNMEITEKMLECGCGKYMGLPEEPDIENFKQVCLLSRQNNIKLRPVTLAASLLRENEDVLSFYMRLKFSGLERNLAFFIVEHRNENPIEKTLKYYQKLIMRTIHKPTDMREFVMEFFKSKGCFEMLKEISEWNISFPINGYDVMSYMNKSPSNDTSKMAVNKKLTGLILNELKDIWIDNDCKLSNENLKSYIPSLIEKLEPTIEIKQKSPKRKKKMSN